ncbi:Zinc finger BED domain-containing protein 1 [Bienertia sinuspersici]
MQEAQRNGLATIAREVSAAHTPESISIFLVFLPEKKKIGRCAVMLSDRQLLQSIRQKVEKAEQEGISPSLTKSTLNYKVPGTSSTPIANAFATVERHQCDVAIVRFLCANGVPFNVLRSPEFGSMVDTLKHAPKDYKPLSADKARTSVLDEVKRDVEKELAPIKDTWGTQGMSIVSDGWTNVKHQPLINVVASNSRGSMFLYAEDFSGVEKTGKAIADFLLTSIDEVGPSNVLQVVTDNAANCKAAGKEIEKVHKHIFWSPCVVHTLNLIFKDFAASFPWIRETYVRGKNIVKYFLNHDQAHAIFKKQSGLELLKVAKTRFASHYLLLKRLSQCREALATTVVLTAWKDWVNSGDERMKALGREVANTISDELFWDEVENILTVTKPIYLMIKFADGEGPKMGEVYEKMDCMIGEVGDIMKNNKHKDDRDKMNEIMVSRWEKMNIPMHCLAFALNPYYYDANYLQIPATGGEARRAPNYDKEVVQGVLDAFDKIGEDEEERKVLRHQLARFQAKEGIFGKLQAKYDAVSLSPIKWWNTYGAETPELAEIAVKVLSQPISSSSAGRVWSTYSFVHSIKRNRLNSLRADKLVFIHSNIRLLSRFTASYKQGPHRKWDIEPESSYLDDSVARLEDMRWEGVETNAAIPRVPKRQRYAD